MLEPEPEHTGLQTPTAPTLEDVQRGPRDEEPIGDLTRTTTVRCLAPYAQQALDILTKVAKRRWRRIIIKAFRVCQLENLYYALEELLQPFHYPIVWDPNTGEENWDARASPAEEEEQDEWHDVEEYEEDDEDEETLAEPEPPARLGICGFCTKLVLDTVGHFAYAVLANPRFWNLILRVVKDFLFSKQFVNWATKLGAAAYIIEQIKQSGIIDYFLKRTE